MKKIDSSISNLEVAVSKEEVTISTNLNQVEILTIDEWYNRVILGDCLEVLRQMPSNLVDLIIAILN